MPAKSVAGAVLPQTDSAKTPARSEHTCTASSRRWAPPALCLALALSTWAYMQHGERTSNQAQAATQCPLPHTVPHAVGTDASRPASTGRHHPEVHRDTAASTPWSFLSAASISTVLSTWRLRKRVFIFEVEGGNDKGPDGHRPDTGPLVAAFQQRGWNATVLYYTDQLADSILRTVAAEGDAYIARINPGEYANYTESAFFDMCRGLARRGVRPFPHPDVMLAYGSKDSLVKVASTDAGQEDTEAYHTVDQFREKFPASLAASDRVLKQNRGSTGAGIWVVQPHRWARAPGLTLTPAHLLRVTQMLDNRRQVMSVADFLSLCEQYITGPGGQLINQRFLPRITEGEVRVLMIFDRPVHLVHKKPGGKGLSATLFSGAKYTHAEVDAPQWQRLMSKWTTVMPQVHKALGGADLPLLWTVDFIADTDSDGSDTWRIGEINCSCVGFTTQLGIADLIAEAAISMLMKCGARTRRYSSLSASLPQLW